RDVDDRMRVVEARSVGPVAPPAEAVLAVADELRLRVLRENDVDVFPVAFVRLPDEVARRVRVRVHVVVVEEPVLQHDLVGFADDAPVYVRLTLPPTRPP